MYYVFNFIQYFQGFNTSAMMQFMHHAFIKYVGSLLSSMAYFIPRTGQD